MASFEDPWQVNADLHSHSHQSDGDLAPTQVAQRASARGVQLWALTDHDELAGITEARASALVLNLPFIAGVEISVTWADTTIHVLGLNIDENESGLIAGLARTRSGRRERAKEMSERLAQVGIHGAFEGALKFVENPDLISRTHFARHLVEAGYCTDVSDVFTRYLSEGRPGFVPTRWASLADAVGWIRGAGGTASVAHPARYKFNDTQAWAFFGEFAQAGGQAIEVVSSSHSSAQILHYAKVAREFGFMGSRGSDFHSSDETHVELGQVPPLPDSVVPVWAHWA
jgi:3',5'-nucleoside bisphosphate phosphatase